MAGHSKWAEIQHRMGARNTKRARVFTCHIRKITVTTRLGGSDPDDVQNAVAGFDTSDEKMERIQN